MQKVINYKTLISDLEDKKWNILVQHGEIAAAVLWEPIDEKLAHLYRWWAIDVSATVQRVNNEELVKR